MRPEQACAATVRESQPEVTVSIALTLTTTRWLTIGDLRTFVEKAEAFGIDDSTLVHTNGDDLIDRLAVSR